MFMEVIMFVFMLVLVNMHILLHMVLLMLMLVHMLMLIVIQVCMVVVMVMILPNDGKVGMVVGHKCLFLQIILTIVCDPVVISPDVCSSGVLFVC